jgi:hypothetical protein
VTLGTTLREAAVYRVADLAELYRQRWQVETALAPLKTTMPMDVWHGNTVPGVLTELMMCAIVYHLVRLVMCQSATRQHLGVERISVLEALRWLGAPSTGGPVGTLIINPIRPQRLEPRVKKRRPKSVPFMITPRQELRQQLIQQERRGSLHAIRPGPHIDCKPTATWRTDVYAAELLTHPLTSPTLVPKNFRVSSTL